MAGQVSLLNTVDTGHEDMIVSDRDMACIAQEWSQLIGVGESMGDS